jgi:L-lactate dehydrogenase complex protein LldF
MPSHIILPAIHKNRAQIRELFEKDGAKGLSLETSDLAGYARKRLREMFLKADIGMSGCNFAVAESGSVALFTNEGNGRMVTSLPGTHLVLMGMERIVPSLADLELMANLLPRSATGQKLTTYLSVMQGPRQSGELDGPEEVHIIILDNGRSRQLGDPEFHDLLNCIRCGACLNVCPVYAQVGGHAYRSPYSGPIGAVLTPRLREDKASAELANASSLCGACSEACPVRIPLHDMLVHLRRKNAEAGFGEPGEGAAFGTYAWIFGKTWRYQAAFALARWGQKLAPWAARFLPGLRAWSRHRSVPKPASQSFRDWWRKEGQKP